MPDQPRGVTSAFRRFAAENAFSVQGIWRLAAWGVMAACALLIAVLTTNGGVGWRRSAVVVSSVNTAAPHPFDAQAETRRLSDSVRDLAAESDKLKSRVAVVEHTMDDVTGSIAKQIAATKVASSAAVPPPWPDNQPPLPPTTAQIAAALAPVVAMPTEYGVDIGSALSIPTLRARWAEIRAAHRDLFDGLRPVVTLKQLSRSSRVELRLVVGPLASADAAAQLCADLAPYRLFCQPTLFAGEHLALE